MTWAEVGIGAAAALPLVAYARRSRDELGVYAFALVVAAAIYVAFPLVAWQPRWVPLELMGVTIYLILAAAGRRMWAPLIGFGWVAHVGWDVLLHPEPAAAGVPAWYPGLCVGFDLVVAAFALAAARGARRADSDTREVHS